MPSLQPVAELTGMFCLPFPSSLLPLSQVIPTELGLPAGIQLVLSSLPALATAQSAYTAITPKATASRLSLLSPTLTRAPFEIWIGILEAGYSLQRPSTRR